MFHLPSIGETTVLFMVAKCVPQSQRDIHAVYNLPRAFQNLWGMHDEKKNVIKIK